MRDLIDIISEAFNRVGVNWTLQTHKQWKAEFTVGRHNFEIIFYKRNNYEADEWGMFFHTEAGDTHNTGETGSRATAVFGAVISAIEEFLTTVRPDYMTFSGDKDEGKADLYTRMLKALLPRMQAIGYVAAVDPRDHGEVRTGFTVKRSHA